MPLVQSLDLLRRRVESPVFQGVLHDVHERVRSGTALSDAFAAHGALIPSVYTASLLAGERSGSLDSVLRRFVEYSKIIATVKRKTMSALIYPVILITLAVILVAHHRPAGRAGLHRLLRQLRRRAAADHPDHRAVSNVLRQQLIFVLIAVAAAVAAFVFWLRQPGQMARFDHLILRLPVVGEIAAQVRDVADGAHAGDAARRRSAARQRARHRRAIGRQSVHRRRSWTS